MKVNDAKLKELATTFKLSAKGIPYSQFKAGVKVEMEHGPKAKGGVSNQTNVTGGKLKKTAKIALAHLEEDPRYYKALDRMEKKLEKTKKRSVSNGKSAKARTKKNTQAKKSKR